jgi:hypothetical protein
LLQWKERERRPLILAKNCTMNGERYKKVLADHLLPFMRIHGLTVFLQDDAPCHKSNVVMNYLKNRSPMSSSPSWTGLETLRT